MAKLYFRFGAMGSSKTANALMTRYNYQERGQNVLMLKPRVENRDGEKIIRSRIGLEAECEFVEDFLESMKRADTCEYAAIIVDEAQFLKPTQVEEFALITDTYHIPVICYGLKTDFQSHLFEGSKRLLELADEIEEIPTVCWCGEKARFNGRIVNGKLATNGEQFFLGGNESYVSLCRKHYMQGAWQATIAKE